LRYWLRFAIILASRIINNAILPLDSEERANVLIIEYARLAGFGYRILAEAIKADLPYHISCPALLICGEKDKAGSAKSYNKKWHQREGLPLKWIKNAGHNSNTDQPDEVNRLIEKFISEINRKGVSV